MQGLRSRGTFEHATAPAEQGKDRKERRNDDRRESTHTETFTGTTARRNWRGRPADAPSKRVAALLALVMIAVSMVAPVPAAFGAGLSDFVEPFHFLERLAPAYRVLGDPSDRGGKEVADD